MAKDKKSKKIEKKQPKESKKIKEIKPKKHNGIISLWKFLFCIMIVIYHGSVLAKKGDYVILSRGSIGVEFFFLVSGYLMANSALNKKENDSIGKETINFVLKKYKTFLPYTILAGLLAITILLCIGQMRMEKFVYSIFDMLLLNMSGIKTFSVNGPIWYISSMLICMLIIYPLIRKYKENFLYIAVPIIVLLGFGYLSYTCNNLRDPNQWIIFTFKGNIRAFIELCLGSLMYLLCEKFKSIDFTTFVKVIITIIEITGFITIFLVSQFLTAKYDFMLVAILSISIILAFSEKTLEYNFLCNKFCYWLEKLSVSIFVFHFSVRLFIRNVDFFNRFSYLPKLGIYVISSIIVSIILMYLLDYLKKKNYFIDKVKKLVIK